MSFSEEFISSEAVNDKDVEEFEGKGIVETFFNLLWTRDPLMKRVPMINIPETVIYKYDVPRVWYFMHENVIKKKNRDKLNNENVEKSFLTNVPECGIVAFFFYKQKKVKGEENTKVVFEYFNESEFRNFMRTNLKPNGGSGILQKFIQPKGDFNFTIKSIWGPRLCVFEKRECIKPINDTKYDLYERAYTYEAEEFHSRVVPLRGYILPNKLEKLSFIIVQHVGNVSFERLQIARMVLNFKIDENDNIWLLYCSFLQLKSLNRNKITNLIDKMFYDIDVEEIVTSQINSKKMSVLKPLSMRKKYFCYNCETHLDCQKAFEINFKTLISSHESDHTKELYKTSKKNFLFKEIREAEAFDKPVTHLNSTNLEKIHKSKFSNKNISIPAIIKKIYPQLKEKEFSDLKENPAFTTQTTSVCEECYLKISKSLDVGGDYDIKRIKINEDENFLGTGRLKPEAIKARTETTKRTVSLKKLANLMGNQLGSKTYLLNIDKYCKEEPPQEEDSNFNITLKTHLRDGGNYIFDIYDEYDLDKKLANRRGTSLKPGTIIESRSSLNKHEDLFPRKSNISLPRKSNLSLIPIQESQGERPSELKKQVFSPKYFKRAFNQNLTLTSTNFSLHSQRNNSVNAIFDETLKNILHSRNPSIPSVANNENNSKEEIILSVDNRGTPANNVNQSSSIRINKAPSREEKKGLESLPTDLIHNPKIKFLNSIAHKSSFDYFQKRNNSLGSSYFNNVDMAREAYGTSRSPNNLKKLKTLLRSKNGPF